MGQKSCRRKTPNQVGWRNSHWEGGHRLQPQTCGKLKSSVLGKWDWLTDLLLG